MKPGQLVIEHAHHHQYPTVRPTQPPTRMRESHGIDGRDAVGLYLDSIARTPLLTAQDEVDLAKAIEAGVFAQRILHGDHSNQVGATTEELERIVEEGHQAFDRFVRSNLRLVVAVARKYGRNAMPLLDLIQEGNTGLLRAVKKFDYTKGFKFSTYATWWIRQAITRGIAQGGHIVKLPVHIAEQINQIAALRANMIRKLGREPELSELAQELNVEMDSLQDLVNLSRQHASLDAPLRDDGNITLADLMADTPQEEDHLGSDDRAALRAMISQLDERSADIIRRRHGLVDGTVMKLADIGAAWGITAERVRQIERAAISTLQSIGWAAGDQLEKVAV